MPKVVIGDLELAYESRGRDDAPVLLAIMGLSGTSGHWRGFPARFEDRYRVVTFDNRGAGETSAPAGPYSTAQMAGDALALLDQLGVAEASVLGVSMGGMIAQELALRAPDRVAKLVLACTTPGGRGAILPGPDVLASFANVGKGGAEATVRRLLALNFSPRFLAASADVFEELVTYGLANRMTPAGFQGQLAAVASHDAAARLPGIRAPTLVLTGDLDRVIPPGNARLLADAIPGARLVMLEGIGHMFWIEAAAEAEAAIRALLDE
ncbi:MAG: alpha/beta fold hydrolase [Labilithrix sp.]|nr:alpha/beta fold hydrolase [Labilithrix sp.]MCW5813102.1 alpha/beta fold hydrolase [Labilithrix sp.]